MRRLIITSDRLQEKINNLGINDTNYQTLDMVQPVVGLREFGVVRVSYSKSWYTVNDSNNFFTIAHGGGTYDIYLTKGNYDLSEFLLMTKAVLEAATIADNKKYDVTSAGGHITITNTAADTPIYNMNLLFGIPDGLVDQYSNSSFRLLGFNDNLIYAQSGGSFPISITGPHMFNLSGGGLKMYLDFPELNTQKSENFNSVSDLNHLFETIPVGGNTGEYQYYEPVYPYIHKIDYSVNLVRLTPQFYWVINDKRYPIDFLGQPYEIVCHYSTKLSRKEEDQENFY